MKSAPNNPGKSEARGHLRRVAEGIYQMQRPAPGGGFVAAASEARRYWVRPRWAGKQHCFRLKAKSLRAAKLEWARKSSQLAMAQAGLARNPFEPEPGGTFAPILEAYSAAGCPKRTEQPRTGRQLVEDQARVTRLLSWWRRKSLDGVSVEDLRAYHLWRIRRARKGRGGHRAADLDLRTLSGAIRWALRRPRQFGLKAHPIPGDWPRFRHGADVRHCRDCQPKSGDDLHRLAALLLADPGSEVLGWQLLLAAFTGQRTSELLRLRWDAQSPKDPGWIDYVDEMPTTLWLYRSQTHKGTAGFIKCDEDLAGLLLALKSWHALNYSKNNFSPWYFPSPLDRRNHVWPQSLGHALRRACQALGLPHVTPHGLRSYFVNVLRSQGLVDAEIAIRIGHKSGGRLIVDVYGEALPIKLSLMPSNAGPAWDEYAGEYAKQENRHNWRTHQELNLKPSDP